MDTTARYMGLSLPSPLVVGASPLTHDIHNVEKMAAAGAGAIVFHSIFEEQVNQDVASFLHYLEQGTESFPEALTYLPEQPHFRIGPELYLEHLAVAKRAVGIPIIGSLNCVSASGWIEYARQIEQVGADGLELNVYQLPSDPQFDGAQVEGVYLDVLAAVKTAVRIPVAVKVGPYFSSMANMLTRLDRAGADGLVLFNRFYQPDIDLDELAVSRKLVPSSPDDLRLPLRWIAIMFGRGLKASLIASSGVHTGADVAKMILCGADAVQVVSALLANGVDYLSRMREAMVALLEAKGYASLAEARGALSQRRSGQPAQFERANYMEALKSFV